VNFKKLFQQILTSLIAVAIWESFRFLLNKAIAYNDMGHAGITNFWFILFFISVNLLCFLVLSKNATPNHNKNRKNDIEYKRSLIVKWRNMINEVIKEKDEDENNIKAAVYLERHKDYYSLKPHLSEETIHQLCRATKFTVGSTISPPLRFILDDIARLEKEWGLIDNKTRDF
jgi:hypothetical protein